MPLNNNHASFCLEQTNVLKAKYPFLTKEQIKKRVDTLWDKLSKDEKKHFTRQPLTPARRAVGSKFFKSPGRGLTPTHFNRSSKGRDLFDDVVQNKSAAYDFNLDSEGNSQISESSSPLVATGLHSSKKRYSQSANYFVNKKPPVIVQVVFNPQSTILKSAQKQRKRHLSRVSFSQDVEQSPASKKRKACSSPGGVTQSRKRQTASQKMIYSEDIKQSPAVKKSIKTCSSPGGVTPRRKRRTTSPMMIHSQDSKQSPAAKKRKSCSSLGGVTSMGGTRHTKSPRTRTRGQQKIDTYMEVRQQKTPRMTASKRKTASPCDPLAYKLNMDSDDSGDEGDCIMRFSSTCPDDEEGLSSQGAVDSEATKSPRGSDSEDSNDEGNAIMRFSSTYTVGGESQGDSSQPENEKETGAKLAVMKDAENEASCKKKKGKRGRPRKGKGRTPKKTTVKKGLLSPLQTAVLGSIDTVFGAEDDAIDDDEERQLEEELGIQSSCQSDLPIVPTSEDDCFGFDDEAGNNSQMSNSSTSPRNGRLVSCSQATGSSNKRATPKRKPAYKTNTPKVKDIGESQPQRRSARQRKKSADVSTSNKKKYSDAESVSPTTLGNHGDHEEARGKVRFDSNLNDESTMCSSKKKKTTFRQQTPFRTNTRSCRGNLHDSAGDGNDEEVTPMSIDTEKSKMKIQVVVSSIEEPQINLPNLPILKDVQEPDSSVPEESLSSPYAQSSIYSATPSSPGFFGVADGCNISQDSKGQNILLASANIGALDRSIAALRQIVHHSSQEEVVVSPELSDSSDVDLSDPLGEGPSKKNMFTAEVTVSPVTMASSSQHDSQYWEDEELFINSSQEEKTELGKLFGDSNRTPGNKRFIASSKVKAAEGNFSQLFADGNIFM